MIAVEGQVNVPAAAAQAPQTEDRQEQKRSIAADALDGVANGIELVGPMADGCKAASNALRPSHATGGKEAPAGFTTGGGDGVANSFQTTADCAPVADASGAGTDIAGIAGDTLSTVGDVVSAAASVAGDVVAGILGGIFDGL